MFVYNVTVNVEASVSADWINWMKSKHIPDVLATGCFVSNRICKLLNVEDEGSTYSVQYTFHTMEDLQRYQQHFAPALQKEHTARYGQKALAFRTLMEIVD